LPPILATDYVGMPRKQRIEYPGAVYHVISRGNYRKELFLSDNGVGSLSDIT